MLKKLLLGATVVALSGCASVGELFLGASNAAYVMDANGQSVSNLILKADLSKAELKTVQQAQNTIVDLREKFRSASVENLLLLHIDYLEAKAAYKAVYDVVVAHEDEYTADEWRLFTDAHATAKALDDSVNEYIFDSDKQNAAGMALQYLNAAAKLAAVL